MIAYPSVQPAETTHLPQLQRVHLVLACDETFRPKARYVMESFCKVLGLDLHVAEAPLSGEAPLPHGEPWIWYGPDDAIPAVGQERIMIRAAADAPQFFAGEAPMAVEDVVFLSWRQKQIPVLFAQDPGSLTQELEIERRHGGDAVTVPFDLLASAFYFLSCWEETVIPDRDQHRRFLYRSSLASKLQLDDNIVDLYLDVFIACLNAVGEGRWMPVEIPLWPDNVPFVACLTHDVDEVRKGRLSRMKFGVRHLLRPSQGHRKTPLLDRAGFALKTLLSSKDPYWTYPDFAAMERRLGFTATYYFQAGGESGRSRYRLTEPPVAQFIQQLNGSEFEIGLHGTYDAGFEPNLLLEEKAILARLLQHEPTGHRNHYLRMEYASTLALFEEAGFEHDATLGYADHEGYRNQFSYPYHPYNHAADRPCRFLELPTVIMDVTLAGYRGLSAEDGWDVMKEWLERTSRRRGCINLLWHNVWDGVYPGYFDLYARALTWIQEHGGVGLSGRDVVNLWRER